MPKAFKVAERLLPATAHIPLKDPRVLVRAALGALVLANIVAALIVFKPWGGSAEDLARQQAGMRQQLTTMQARLAQTKALVGKAQRAHQEGDAFLAEDTSERRTVFSTLFAELDSNTREAGTQPRPESNAHQPVEGSDSLYQITITAAYEGPYANLTKFVNL